MATPENKVPRRSPTNSPGKNKTKQNDQLFAGRSTPNICPHFAVKAKQFFFNFFRI
jgi:hypothetical protein